MKALWATNPFFHYLTHTHALIFLVLAGHTRRLLILLFQFRLTHLKTRTTYSVFFYYNERAKKLELGYFLVESQSELLIAAALDSRAVYFFIIFAPNGFFFLFSLFVWMSLTRRKKRRTLPFFGIIVLLRRRSSSSSSPFSPLLISEWLHLSSTLMMMNKPEKMAMVWTHWAKRKLFNMFRKST